MALLTAENVDDEASRRVSGLDEGAVVASFHHRFIGAKVVSFLRLRSVAATAVLGQNRLNVGEGRGAATRSGGRGPRWLGRSGGRISATALAAHSHQGRGDCERYEESHRTDRIGELPLTQRRTLAKKVILRCANGVRGEAPRSRGVQFPCDAKLLPTKALRPLPAPAVGLPRRAGLRLPSGVGCAAPGTVRAPT